MTDQPLPAPAPDQPPPTKPPAADRPPRPKTPDLRADAAMPDAARRLLAFHLARLTELAGAPHAASDGAAVHKMRVAARRQRAALRLFADYFKPKALRPFRRALKTLAGRLGAVRDLDVALDEARAYQAQLDLPTAAAFEPLLAAWEAERETARAALAHALQRKSFRRFTERFQAFLDTPGAGERPTDPGAPTHVQEVLPALFWERYGAVRAYAPLVPGASVSTLHTLRLTAKHLRDALEFFAPVLGAGAAPVIDPVVALQDHLGALHDTAVALQRLERFTQRRPHRPGRQTRAAVAGYAQQQQARLTQLCRTVNRPWKPLLSKAFRQALAQAAARL